MPIHKRRPLLIFLSLLLLICCLCVGGPLIAQQGTGRWAPAWSPDGRQLAFECMYAEFSDLDKFPDEGAYARLRDICIFNRRTQTLQRITTDHPVGTPAWSPDGRWLAWIHQGHTLVLWEVATQQEKRFQSGNYFSRGETYLAWSADSRTIFIQGDGAQFDVAESKFIPLSPSLRLLDACCYIWSLDKQNLAYQYNTLAATSASGQLVVLRAGETISVSGPGTRVNEPRQWSPDGKTLAWVAGENPDRLALSYASTGETIFLPLDNWITGIAWSPNGNQIALRLGDKIRILGLQLQEAQPFVSLITIRHDIQLAGDSFGGLAWSPDAREIVYESSWQANSRIWITSLDGQNQQSLP